MPKDNNSAGLMLRCKPHTGQVDCAACARIVLLPDSSLWGRNDEGGRRKSDAEAENAKHWVYDKTALPASALTRTNYRVNYHDSEIARCEIWRCEISR